MKTEVDCPVSRKKQQATIDQDTINVVEGQVAFLARCEKCGRLHAKVMGLEVYKAERLAQL